jgi:hypothetical protein
MLLFPAFPIVSTKDSDFGRLGISSDNASQSQSHFAAKTLCCFLPDPPLRSLQPRHLVISLTKRHSLNAGHRRRKYSLGRNPDLSQAISFSCKSTHVRRYIGKRPSRRQFSPWYRGLFSMAHSATPEPH